MTGWVLEKGSDALGQADNIDRKFGNYFSAFVSVNPTGAGRKEGKEAGSEPICQVALV